jgi:hypothetical protein
MLSARCCAFVASKADVNAGIFHCVNTVLSAGRRYMYDDTAPNRTRAEKQKLHNSNRTRAELLERWEIIKKNRTVPDTLEDTRQQLMAWIQYDRCTSDTLIALYDKFCRACEVPEAHQITGDGFNVVGVDGFVPRMQRIFDNPSTSTSGAPRRFIFHINTRGNFGSEIGWHWVFVAFDILMSATALDVALKKTSVPRCMPTDYPK